MVDQTFGEITRDIRQNAERMHALTSDMLQRLERIELCLFAAMVLLAGATCCCFVQAIRRR